MKKICPMLLISVAALIVLTVANTGLASETRGIRVMARESKSGQQKEIKLYNKSYAVIIGIDQYKNLSFDMQLSYAVQDAKGVEDALKKHFKFDEIITIFNKEATKDNITKILSGDLSRLSKEDSVFIFWAGHGYTEKTPYGDLGYLIPFDGSFKNSEMYMNISMTTIKDVSKRIPAKHIFFVMDSCYSGLMAEKRGSGRTTKRNFEYIKEITKEDVRQVLTAGSKNKQVLDGGPMGHSVFTGRFIEVLAGTDDFITATEMSTLVKEKVFSDAKARDHIQTPTYGELFGMGDYVFVPSLERKAEDTQTQLDRLEAEQKRLEEIEKKAATAKDERAKRLAELERNAVEAKLIAERLKRDRLAAEKKRREEETAALKAKEKEIALKKKEADLRLAALKEEVKAKREAIGDTSLQSISPLATIKEMKEIDSKINEIKERFRRELANTIETISQQVNLMFQETANAKQDEFETKEEFEDRLLKKNKEAGKDQTILFTQAVNKIQDAYSKEVKPFKDALIKLSGQSFNFIAQDLSLALEKYDPKYNVYPVTINAKKEVSGFMIQCGANIPIPREEARIFKQHFENNILRAEISGNFQSIEFFRITKACIINDATGKKYDLFSSKFVELGNELIYDTELNLLWTKNANYFNKEMTWKEAEKKFRNLIISGLPGWRLPSRSELLRMCDVYKNLEIHPFEHIHAIDSYYQTSTPERGGRACIGLGSCKNEPPCANPHMIWPVRGGNY